jgi:hypothetical protein
MWFVASLGSRLSPDRDDWDCNSTYDYATNALGAAAFLLMAAAILILYLWQRGRTGRLGTIGFVMAFAGSVAAGVNNPIEHCAGVAAMGVIVWVPAVLVMLGGMLTLGIATIRAKVLPVWAGGAVILGTLGIAAAFESGGLLILGCAWVLVSYAMWSSRYQSSSRLA